MAYTASDLRRMTQYHVDAITDPSHPLFNHPITNGLADLAVRSGLQANQLGDALAPHFAALEDPAHPLASHPITQAYAGAMNAPAMPTPAAAPASPAMRAPGINEGLDPLTAALSKRIGPAGVAQPTLGYGLNGGTGLRTGIKETGHGAAFTPPGGIGGGSLATTLANIGQALGKGAM